MRGDGFMAGVLVINNELTKGASDVIVSCHESLFNITMTRPAGASSAVLQMPAASPMKKPTCSASSDSADDLAAAAVAKAQEIHEFLKVLDVLEMLMVLTKQVVTRIQMEAVKILKGVQWL